MKPTLFETKPKDQLESFSQDMKRDIENVLNSSAQHLTVDTTTSQYFSLCKLQFEINEDSSKAEKYLKQLIFTFQDTLKLDTFFQTQKLQIKNFFLLKYKTALYFVVVGNTILIDDWNIEVEKMLQSYLNKNFDCGTKHSFNLQDLTYWSANKEIKPRRLRSLGGSLRKILENIKKTFSPEEIIFSDFEFCTIIGSNEKLKATFIAIKGNKKIPRLKQLDSFALLKKQAIMNKNTLSFSSFNTILNYLDDNVLNHVEEIETISCENKLDKNKTDIDKLKKINTLARQIKIFYKKFLAARNF